MLVSDKYVRLANKGHRELNLLRLIERARMITPVLSASTP